MNIAIDESMKPYCEKIMEGEYDIKGLELPEGATVLDIGACCGEFTAWALERWPGCKVIAYEPNPEAFKYLKENYDGNARVHLVNAAVRNSDYTGQPLLYRGRNNIGEASFFIGETKRNCDDVICTPDVVTALPPADLVKIDTEGSETEILPLVDMAAAKAVVLEWHGRDRGKQCAELLAPGYGRKEFGIRGIMRWRRPEEGDVFRPLEITENAPPTDEQLFIGIPVHYQPTASFMTSCMSLAAKAPKAGWEILVGDAHPDRARHRIIAKFLRSDKQYLLFLDADLKFEADQILSLLKREKDMICGFYCKKQPGPPQWVGNALDPKEDADGLVKMREAATGCLLIHRRVFEAIIRAYPELRYTTDPNGEEVEYAVCQSGVFFDRMANRRRWLSEDWALCQRAQDCGFTIYGDPAVVCLHQGMCTFPTEPGPAKGETKTEGDSA